MDVKPLFVFALAVVCGVSVAAVDAAARPLRAKAGEMCGGIAGIVCRKGLVCQMGPGTCRTADASGLCRPRPQTMCTAIYLPVCGCDGKTYGNDCMREGAGVQLAHEGACAR